MSVGKLPPLRTSFSTEIARAKYHVLRRHFTTVQHATRYRGIRLEKSGFSIKRYTFLDREFGNDSGLRVAIDKAI